MVQTEKKQFSNPKAVTFSFLFDQIRHNFCLISSYLFLLLQCLRMRCRFRGMFECTVSFVFFWTVLFTLNVYLISSVARPKAVCVDVFVRDPAGVRVQIRISSS